MILKKIDAGQIAPPLYDVVLVDEAQDFAPSWMQLIKRIMTPEDGLIFLADDPTQSIYRYFSWKEKGVAVAGRTVRLRVPYRNTYEIYQLAFGLVREDAVLQQAMNEEGVLLDADVNPDRMRHGPRPLLRKHESFNDQVLSLRSSIQSLLQKGCDPRQVAVLHRRKKGVTKLQGSLNGLDVNIGTFHAYKGLEFDYVFLTDMQDAFQGLSDEQEISEERRLLYMASTRARQQLTMTYQGVLPKQLRDLSDHVDMI
jgi:superfamily I DNA/RNA helicase